MAESSVPLGMGEVPTPPDYGAASLSAVLPSAAAALGVPGYADALSVAEACGGVRRLVVLLVDGLGWRQLQDHPDLAPVLAGSPGRALSTSFPSTTPVGLGTLGTGMPPGMHGMVGATFMLPETEGVLHPLSWGDDPHPSAVQPERTVLEIAAAAGVDVQCIGPRAFAATGLTRAVLRGGAYRGADSVGERVAALAEIGDGPSLTYAYWGDLDKCGHVHGVDSPAWRSELAHVDWMVEAMTAAMPRDSALLITADHGMVDCPDASRVDLDADPALRFGVGRIAGEPRMRHVYARRGAGEEVVATWAEVLGDRAWVLSREGAVDMGLLGDVEPDYAERVGDVLAIARDRTALVSAQVDSVVSSLRGQHGSLSREEMEIPFIVVPGGR
ncbi:MAG: alkaline phosphatase family protein [Candidatus Nanopelagicales bacterium]